MIEVFVAFHSWHWLRAPVFFKGIKKFDANNKHIATVVCPGGPRRRPGDEKERRGPEGRGQGDGRRPRGYEK